MTPKRFMYSRLSAKETSSIMASQIESGCPIPFLSTISTFRSATDRPLNRSTKISVDIHILYPRDCGSLSCLRHLVDPLGVPCHTALQGAFDIDLHEFGDGGPGLIPVSSPVCSSIQYNTNPVACQHLPHKCHDLVEPVPLFERVGRFRGQDLPKGIGFQVDHFPPVPFIEPADDGLCQSGFS